MTNIDPTDPTSPRTEPIHTIKAAQHSTAHYVNVGPRRASEPVPAGDVAVQQDFETGLPDQRTLRRGRMLDRLDRGLWITSIVLATFVGLAAVWALIAEPMGWLP